MSHMPVLAVSISEGVVIGVLRILFRVLSLIFCIWFSYVWVGVQVSAPYVIIGIMQEWHSLHIVAISMLWNSSFDASVSIVWRATSVFLLVSLYGHPSFLYSSWSFQGICTCLFGPWFGHQFLGRGLHHYFVW